MLVMSVLAVGIMVKPLLEVTKLSRLLLCKLQLQLLSLLSLSLRLGLGLLSLSVAQVGKQVDTNSVGLC